MTLATSPMTAGALWAELARQIGRRSDARWIVCHITGMSAGQLRTSLEDELTPAVVDEGRRLAARCRAGEPVQYVIGGWAFRTLELELDPRVLVPRPETEQVAGAALDLLCGRDAGGALVVADLGTGSGAIALSLALESPVPLQVWATDFSPDALAVAERNREIVLPRLALGTSVHLAAGSWYDALPAHLRGRLDMVVSNPPYVAHGEWEALDPMVRDHEPYGALVPGESGTEAVDVVVAGAAHWLAPAGTLVVEIGAGQGVHGSSAAASAGLTDVEVRPDLAGHDRILVARRPA